MRKEIGITWCENKTSAKLEWILSEFVLTVSSGFGTLSGNAVVAPEEMQQRSLFQFQGTIGLALLVDQKWEANSALFAKGTGIVGIAESDGGECGAFLLKGLLVFAQLRDVLAAEDSTIVAEKDHHRGMISPKRSQANLVAVSIRQNDIGEPTGKFGGIHGLGFV